MISLGDMGTSSQMFCSKFHLNQESLFFQISTQSKAVISLLNYQDVYKL